MEGINYRVLKFFGQNCMGMKVFAVDLDRNVVEVQGANGAGKSSFMEGLPMLFGGKRAMPQMPLRKGETEGFVGCVLGDNGPELMVKRRLDGQKPELEVRSAEGFLAPEPQTILNAFKNDLSFNPGEFCRAESKKQVEMVRKLVGLDFTELEEDRKRLYDERTQANKMAKMHDAQIAGIVVPDDTPDGEVSVMSLMVEQKRRQEHNRKNQIERDRIGQLQRDATGAGTEVLRLEETVADLESRLKRCRDELDKARDRQTQAILLVDTQKATIAVLQDEDVDEVQQQIVNAQTINANVAKRERRDSMVAEKEKIAATAKRLTEQINALDAAKERQLADAKWPVPGLSLGDDGVLYNGIPISQVNNEKRLRIGIAVCAAMNPKLVAIRIENASLLDRNELAAAKQEARERDLQLWLEVVSVDPPDVLDAEIIFIADGAVVSGTPISEIPSVAKTKKPRKKKEAESDTIAQTHVDSMVDAAADDFAERHGTGVSEFESTADLPFGE